MPDTPEVGFQFGVEGDRILIESIRQLRAELKQTKTQQDSLASSAVGLAGAWRGLVAVAGAFKLAQFARDTFDSAVSIGRLSAATGISTQTLSVYRNAVTSAGLSSQTADISVKRLSRSILELQQGNKQAAVTFAMLRDAAGKPLTAQSFQGLSQDQQFLKVADALGRLKGSLAATGASQRLLGRDSGELLSVMQRLAGSGFAEVYRETQALGLVLTPELVNAALRAEGSLADIESVAKGAATQFESGLMPALADTADALVHSADAGGNGFKMLGEWIGWVVKGFAELIIWAKAFGLTIAESIGGALSSTGTMLFSIFKAAGQAATADFSGALATLKAGANQGAAVVNDVIKNSQDRMRAALEAEKLLADNQAQRKPRPEGRDIDTGAALAANAARGEMALARAKVAAAKEAAQEEIALYRALNQEREAEDKDAYDRGLITMEEYFRRRRENIAGERDLEIKALQGEKGGLQGLLGSAQKLPTLTPQDDLSKQAAILGIKQQIAAVDNKIQIAQVHAQTETEAAGREQFKDEQSHQVQQLEFERKLAEVQGNRAKAAELANQVDDLKVTRELQQLGKTQAEIDALLAQLRSARAVKAAGEEAKGGFEGEWANLQQQKAAIPTGKGLAPTPAYQRERMLADLYRTETPLLQAKVDLLRQQAAAAAGTGEGVTLIKQADEEQAKINQMQAQLPQMDTSWQQWKTTAVQCIGQVSTTLTTGLNGWISGHEKFGKAMIQMWNSIVMEVIGAIEKIIAKELVQLAVQKLLSFAGGFFGLAGGGMVQGFSRGGLVASPGFAAGGYVAARCFPGGGSVSGPGSSTSDSIPARLSNGEYVLNARAVSQIGPQALDAMNRGANLPTIRQSAPYGANGLKGYGEVSPAGGDTHNFDLSTHLGHLSALDGASVRGALQEHGDLVGKIAVAAVKRFYRSNGVG